MRNREMQIDKTRQERNSKEINANEEEELQCQDIQQDMEYIPYAIYERNATTKRHL